MGYKFTTTWYLAGVLDEDGNNLDFGTSIEVTYRNNIQNDYNPLESEDDLIPGQLSAIINNKIVDPILVNLIHDFGSGCALIIERALIEDIPLYWNSETTYYMPKNDLGSWEVKDFGMKRNCFNKNMKHI